MIPIKSPAQTPMLTPPIVDSALQEGSASLVFDRLFVQCVKDTIRSAYKGALRLLLLLPLRQGWKVFYRLAEFAGAHHKVGWAGAWLHNLLQQENVLQCLLLAQGTATIRAPGNAECAQLKLSEHKQ